MSKAVLYFFLFFSGLLVAQPVDFTNIDFKQYYKVGTKKEVYMPLGKISFADEVIRFVEGVPRSLKSQNYPQYALGEPDFESYPDQTYLSLGCHGNLVVKFDDNGFINIEGPDLYFFEVGPSVEAFQVEISTNGRDWIYVGDVTGGYTQVDISEAEEEGDKEVYYYVKLKDLGSFCDGPSAGADIDAIGAISGVLKVNIAANLLFDLDKYNLKNESVSALNDFLKGLKKFENGEVIIEGHTDNQGTHDYNMELSENRSQAVKNYLREHLENPGSFTFKTKSFGETEPIESNLTQEGRQQNRRVEIIVIPNEEFYKPKK